MISEKQSKARLVCFGTWSISYSARLSHGMATAERSYHHLYLSLPFLVLPGIARCWWDKLLLTTILKQAKGKKWDTVFKKKLLSVGGMPKNGTRTRWSC